MNLSSGIRQRFRFALKAILTLVVTTLLAFAAQAATIHVPGDQPTIQMGISAAASGDTVLVACGTYYESHIVLASTLVLAGANGMSCAVIDGGQQGPILTIAGGNATVSDLTFRNGAAYQGGAIKSSGSPMIVRCRFEDNQSSNSGGAVHGGNLYVADCEFVSNSAGGGYGGGAMDLRSGSPVVERCTFRSNTAVRGGGLAVVDGVVRDCLFESNSVTTSGGGLRVDYSGTVSVQDCIFASNASLHDGGGASTNTCAASFLHCRFEGNTAERDGGGMKVYNSDIPTAFCVFVENHAGRNGGGYVGDSANTGDDHSSTVTNCTFWGNSALAGGGIAGTRNGFPSFQTCIVAGSTQGGAFAWESVLAKPVLACCDLWGNTGGDWTGLIADQANVNGNIFADPLFCDPEDADFFLQSNSPCAPANSDGCGLIGAFGVGCEPIHVESKSWGAIKSLYR